MALFHAGVFSGKYVAEIYSFRAGYVISSAVLASLKTAGEEKKAEAQTEPVREDAAGSRVEHSTNLYIESKGDLVLTLAQGSPLQVPSARKELSPLIPT